MKMLLDIPDNETAFALKVFKSLSFIKKVRPMSVSASKLWDDLKEAA